MLTQQRDLNEPAAPFCSLIVDDGTHCSIEGIMARYNGVRAKSRLACNDIDPARSCALCRSNDRTCASQRTGC